MRKSQSSMISVIVILLIGVTVISVIIPYIGQLLKKGSEYKQLRSTAEHIGDLLLTEGHPYDWEVLQPNSTEIRRLGIFDGEIDDQKLSTYARIPYPHTKVLLGTKYDYMFFIEKNGQKLRMDGKEFLGWNAWYQDLGNGGTVFDFYFDIIDEKAEQIAKSERIVRFGNEHAKLIIYTWSTVNFGFEDLQCANTRDDEDPEDEVIDFPADIGCEWWDDNNETDPPYRMECRYTSSECFHNETEVLQLSYAFFGQQHAAAPGGMYTNRICCYYGPYLNVTLAPACAKGGTQVARLDRTFNAHVQTGGSYPHSLCMHSTGPSILCSTAGAGQVCDDLQPGSACLFSMDKTHNAHVAPCDSTYLNRRCCGFDVVPGSPNPPPPVPPQEAES